MLFTFVPGPISDIHLLQFSHTITCHTWKIFPYSRYIYCWIYQIVAWNIFFCSLFLLIFFWWFCWQCWCCCYCSCFYFIFFHVYIMSSPRSQAHHSNFRQFKMDEPSNEGNDIYLRKTRVKSDSADFRREINLRNRFLSSRFSFLSFKFLFSNIEWIEWTLLSL